MSQQINLFDARFRRGKRRLSAATLATALAVVAGLALAVQQLYAYQNRSLQTKLAHADRRIAELRGQMVRFSEEMSAQGASSALGDEMVRVEERLRARRGLLSSLQTGAGNAEGFSPYLAALARQTMDGVWLIGIEINEDLVVKGRALDGELVPAYIGRLNREESFAGRSVSELRLSAKPDSHLEFSLSIPLGKGPS